MSFTFLEGISPSLLPSLDLRVIIACALVALAYVIQEHLS